MKLLDAYLRRPALLVLLVGVTGCQSPPSDGGSVSAAKPSATGLSEADLLQALPVDSDWVLSKSSFASLNRAEAGVITLHIAPSRLSGNSGCNQFSAGYQLNERQLAIGPAAATKRGCAPPLNEIEQALFATLPTLVKSSMDGGDLLLHDANGGSLRFSPSTVVKE